MRALGLRYHLTRARRVLMRDRSLRGDWRVDFGVDRQGLPQLRTPLCTPATRRGARREPARVVTRYLTVVTSSRRVCVPPRSFPSGAVMYSVQSAKHNFNRCGAREELFFR